jgi:4-hydroxy-4-methyl-2-oxoglutarate aldolase
MPVTIHKSNAGIDADLMKRWRSVPAAIIADVSKGEALIDPAIRPLRPIGQQSRLFGIAVAVQCAPPDFGAVLHALDLVKPDEVLVIAAQGITSHAMIGGILGGYLHRKKAAGIVCDGAVRDVSELAAMESFPVYARAITPRGPTAWTEGAVNAPVTIGTMKLQSGDLLIGDEDGLVCLSPDDARALIDAAEAKLALEDGWIKSLKSGKSVAETFNLPDLKA